MAQVINNNSNSSDQKDQPQNDNNNNNQMNKLKFEKIAANALHISRHGGWLESRFHFRFAGWMPMDKKRHGFGKLHVLNDDIVQPSNGFGMHPHRDQEIFSYILSGSLTHQDSKGNKETLSRGHVQYMTAGQGVWHSEMNTDNNKTCRFLQTWIYPNKLRLPVRYGSHKFKLDDRKNKLLQIINGEGNSNSNSNSNGDNDNDNGYAAPIRLHQDVNVYVSELDYNKSIQYKLNKGRIAYLLCPEGSVNVNNVVELETRAAVRLYGNDNELNIVATYNNNNDIDNGPSAHIMMIEMKAD